jgi:hypothetical protein
MADKKEYEYDVQPFNTGDSMVHLYVMLISDGYAAGAARSAKSRYPKYWPMGYRENNDWSIISVEVPEDTANKMVADGYRDGYEAWQAVLKYNPDGGKVLDNGENFIE